MPPASVVVYVSPKIASNYTVWCLEPVAGVPLIRRLLSRIQTGLAAQAGEPFHLVCQDDVVFPKLKEALAGLSVNIFRSGASSRLGALAEFTKAHPQVGTFLLFSEHAVFPDCVLAGRMLEAHRRFRMEATVARDAPAGLLPDIFDAPAIQRLNDLGVADDGTTDLFATMQKSDALAGDDPTLRFRTQVFKAEEAAGPRPLSWPARLLVDDLRAQRAAEAVIGKKVAGNDSEPAVAFKTELLAQRPESLMEIPAASADDRTAILFSTSFKAFSGAEECFYDLIAGLDRRRYAPAAVLPARGVLSEKLAASGVPTIILPLRFDRLTPFNVRAFTEILKRLRIRLVHINVDAGPALVVAAQQLGLPIVTHVRSFMGGKVPELLQFSDKIITVSKIVREDILRSDLPPEDVVAIYDGQTFDAFNPGKYDKAALRAEAGIAMDQPVLCMIARICAQKRPKFLVEALPEVIARFPKALALIVGEAYPADAGYKEELHQLIKQKHLQNYVRFWGFEKEIAKIHVLSDVMALCTEREPFGHCILEALAMGLPTVTPRSGGGHVEILKDGDNGILYESGDPKYLSKALIRLLSDPRLLKKIAQQGQKTIASLDIQTHVQAVSRLYDDLLSSAR